MWIVGFWDGGMGRRTAEPTGGAAHGNSGHAGVRAYTCERNATWLQQSFLCTRRSRLCRFGIAASRALQPLPASRPLAGQLSQVPV